MAKKKVTRKTITKPKIQEAKEVVKEKVSVKVNNKSNKVGAKEKISRILLFVSLALIVVAFCTTFAPAFKIEWECNGEIIATGTLTSLFTCLLRASRATAYTYDNGVEVYKFFGRGFKRGVLNYVGAAFIVLLVLIAIATLVLVLTKKYKGKVKLILSIATCVFLIFTVATVLLSKTLFKVSSPNTGHTPDIPFDSIRLSSLYIAPILYSIVGGCALGTGAISFILDHK